MLIALVGISGSGKTTLMNNCVNNLINIKKIVAVTTRPKRNNEINHFDKHFVSVKEFKELEMQNKLCLIDDFYNHHYAFFKSDFITPIPIICEVYHKNIDGIKKFIDRTIVIYVKPSDKGLAIQALEKRDANSEQNQIRIQNTIYDQEMIDHLVHERKINYEFTNFYNEKSLMDFNILIRNILHHNLVTRS